MLNKLCRLKRKKLNDLAGQVRGCWSYEFFHASLKLPSSYRIFKMEANAQILTTYAVEKISPSSFLSIGFEQTRIWNR